MTRIGLLSDTHSYLDSDILSPLADCDQIWHAGDLGNIDILTRLQQHAPVVHAVYGNIDGADVRAELPLDAHFAVEGVTIYITHIGGYPGRYTPRVRKALDLHRPDLYVCGHSHILKVMPDKRRGLLHMNPGACGHHGFHQVRTVLRFHMDAGRIDGLEVVELGKRGRI